MAQSPDNDSRERLRAYHERHMAGGAGLFRRNRLLLGLGTLLGRLFPAIGDGVLVLAERNPA